MLSNIIDIIHSDWLIYNLEEYVTPIELRNLKHVSKYFYKNITSDNFERVIIKSIYKQLHNILKSQYNKFIKHMTQNNAVISGSFIIQCILGKYYEGSDIDVYSFLDTTKKTFFDIIDKEELTATQHMVFAEYDELPNIGEILNIHLKNGFYLQNIQLHNISSFGELKEFIIKDFDFNICKNLFTIINGKPKLYIHNLTRILNKTEVISTLQIDEKTKIRIEKYILRGFTFKFGSNNIYDINETRNLLNYIKCDKSTLPILVYKNDENGRFEKLTFLGIILDRRDAFCKYHLNDGNVLLCDDLSKYIETHRLNPSVADMKNVLEFVYGKNIADDDTEFDITKELDINQYISERKNTMCRIKNIKKKIKNKINYDNDVMQKLNLEIPHILKHCQLYSGPGSSMKLMNLVMINYDDMDNISKEMYTKFFDTKVCDESFLQCYKFQSEHTSSLYL